MSLLAYLALKTLTPKARQFENATKDPSASQRKILFDYLGRNRNTEYGKIYNFSGIRSVEEYQKAVPMSDCDSLRPYIERRTTGEDNILTADRPIFFGLTSGTTARQKFIPVKGLPAAVLFYNH